MSMSASRLVKWSKEAQEFFEKADNNSVTLDIVISVGSVSQTGFGFEDLVNSINSESIKKKIKKVNITDTTYLYRHCIPEFSRSCKKDIPTLWYINNKIFIDDLDVETKLKSWVEDINKNDFKIWHQQIIKDFAGDENGIGTDRIFRELVIADAAVAASKGNGTFQQCVSFILEESVHMCVFLRNSVIAYPMSFYDSVNYIIECYKLNLKHLHYKISNYSRKRNNNIKNLAVEKDIMLFLGEFLDANFL
jgi:hypothetical protein